MKNSFIYEYNKYIINIMNNNEENNINDIYTNRDDIFTNHDDIFTNQEHIFENNEIEEVCTLESNMNLSNLDFNHTFHNMNDSINDFNDKLNEYRNIEHKILVNDKVESKSIKNHILVHLENQIDLIEKNFEKITHKQFDKIVDENEDYNEELNKKLEKILGFSLEEYNKKSLKIELSINEICNHINNYFSELRNDIYNLNVLNYKIHFISNYESTIENKKDNLNHFFELVDTYENNIKKDIENKLNKKIKDKIENIHQLFNMLKILQSQLYVKIVTKYSCGICLTNNIDSYYNNCGHVICKSCGIKNRNNNICPFCKRESALKNLFFI